MYIYIITMFKGCRTFGENAQNLKERTHRQYKTEIKTTCCN